MRYEALEGRELLAANIQITNVLVVDASNNVMTAPVVGQMVFLRAEWRTTDLTSANQYVVRFSIDGVPLDSGTVTGAPGTNLNYNWYRGGWYASPGLHNVSVTIDGANVVAETTEADNTLATSFTPITPTDLPTKFIWPLPSLQSQDWTIVNYNDVNPNGTAYQDYRGGTYTYDGHNAFDITLTDFRDMDLGEPIYAAASGTVVSTQDGKFDRQTVWNGQDANYVIIDHGNGWQTFYWHMARNTMTVSPGDAVQAGQLIGFVGSSGISSAAHVHFGVSYRGAVVETYYAPSTYFFNPPSYQADAPLLSMGSGITNYDYFAAGDYKERASTINVFPSTYTGPVYFYYWLSHQHAGDNWNITWYRPNGTVDATSSGAYAGSGRDVHYYWFLTRTWGNNPGAWQVAFSVNGVEVARESFQIVTPALAVPEIRVTQASQTTLDERTTPYDFGSVAQGSAAPQQTWTIENRGYVPLNLSNFVLPAGFSIVGSPPTQVSVGGNATLTLQMSTATPGNLFGAVEFATNDPSEGIFSFNVEGTITGAPPAGTPVLTTTGRNAPYHAGHAAVVVEPQLSVSDPNTTVWTAGSLNVRFASNLKPGDLLEIRNQGTGAGQIGVSGSDISYQGTVIGVASGSASDLTITFNSSATLAALQALARNITYRNTLAAPLVAARYLAFKLTDETGLAATAYKTVTLLNDPPTISNIADQVITADTSTGPLAFALGSADKVRTALNVSATSSNPALVSPVGIALGGSLGSRTINVTPLAGQTGTTTISVTVTDVNGGTAVETFVVTVTAAVFQVTQTIPTPTGAIVQFNRQLNPTDLNLVDVSPTLLGPADVTLIQNGTTSIAGSVTISPDRRSIAFVAFSGALPDGSYSLTLRSAADGFKDISANLLDGNNDGTGGDNYTRTFSVASTARQISIPSFARGPQQPVDLPTTSTGLPLTISDGTSVTQISATLFYDPTMLSVTGATLPTGLPVGTTLTTDVTVPGRIIVSVNSPSALSAGPVNFVALTATVPSNAPYTGKNFLDLTNLQLNGGAIPVRDVDGVHVVAFFGDTTANGAYSALDASRVQRVSVGLDNGFAAYQLLDPRIIADITGNAAVSALDASRILQLGVGFSVPNVPPLPTGVTVTVTGPDPRLWIPTNISARPGESLRIPVNVDSVVDLTGNGLSSVDLALSLDPSSFEIVSVDRGDLTADTSWLLTSRIDDETGVVQLGMATTQAPLEGAFSGTLAWLHVRVKDSAALGDSSINLLAHAPTGQQTLVNEGQLTLLPAISNDSDDPDVDGVISILPPASMDVNGDGRVSNLDALLVINGLNEGNEPALNGDINHDGRLSAFDALQIINAVDDFHKHARPMRESTPMGRGASEVGEHVSGGDLHGPESLPIMSPEYANLPGGLEAVLHLLALEAFRPKSVRIRTALPLA